MFFRYLGTSGASIASTGISDSLLLTGIVNETTDLAFTCTNIFDFGITNLSGNATGQLYPGNGTNGDFGDIYLQVIPEPSRALLLIGSLALLLFRRHR